jgi:hypothetical protein
MAIRRRATRQRLSRVAPGHHLEAYRVNRIQDRIHDLLMGPRSDSPSMDSGSGSHFSNRFPWEVVSNGYSIENRYNRVVTRNVRLQWSNRGYFDAVDAYVTISGTEADYYVGFEFNGSSITVLAASTNEATFESDTNVFRTWTHKFTRSGGVIYHAEAGCMGIVHLDASLG